MNSLGDIILSEGQQERGACTPDPNASSSQPSQSDTYQVYAIEMDIEESLEGLLMRAGDALNLDFKDFRVTVLGERELSPEDTLQKQCGTAAGLVQVHFILKTEEDEEQGERNERRDKKHGRRRRGRGVLDIVDVLKATKDDGVHTSKPISLPTPSLPSPATGGGPRKCKTTRWIISSSFQEFQKDLNIPSAPQDWSITHVNYWLAWAEKQFSIHLATTTGAAASNTWNIDGRKLLSLTQQEFRKLVLQDPGDLFYMHFELLRKTGVVAVVCDPSTPTLATMTQETAKTAAAASTTATAITVKTTTATTFTSGATQKIQLWQFLLELLTEPKMQSVISWYGDAGEFRLHQPEIVADLWGKRKGKKNMNYEKLSRALRYYYEGDMIAKVSGVRFVYRYTIDLKSVLGYSAKELKEQVEGPLI